MHNDPVLMQALHDPENQPSQWGTVPYPWFLAMQESLRWAHKRITRKCPHHVSEGEAELYQFAKMQTLCELEDRGE